MTALAGAGLRVTPANPSTRLAAIPATVTDLVEKMFVRHMVILLVAREPKVMKPLQMRPNILSVAKDE
jgi:hypothetical protein